MEQIHLDHGSHSTRDEGMCLMEAVAFVAGEPHSDHPACSCPILAFIGRALNDRWDDEERQLLAPLIPRLVGTRSTSEVARRRAYAMADVGIREIAPMGLEAVGWRDLADRMRAIDPVVDGVSGERALKACRSIRDEARKRRAAAAADDAAAADAAAADADADAAADAAAAAAAYADAYAAYASEKLSLEERDRIRRDARRPVIEATLKAFERAIEIR